MQYSFHGDVIFTEVKKLPKGLKKVKRNPKYDNTYILAEGEVTGHAHRINDEVELYERDGVLYMKNLNACTITHEEHNATVIPSGTWEIGIAKEYDYLEQETRRVAD